MKIIDIRGREVKDFTTLEADIEAILARTDVLLSTRASEATLGTRLGQGSWDRARILDVPVVGRDALGISLERDIVGLGREATLGTRASEATLTTLRDRINEQSPITSSTTALLGPGGTFTGTEFSVAGWGRIIGTCFANVAGTLRIDQRNDGVNWDSRNEQAYIAGSFLGFTIEVVGNEARLVFINGATAQTTFRLFGRLRRI